METKIRVKYEMETKIRVKHFSNWTIYGDGPQTLTLHENEVLISGVGIEQLLGVPKLSAVTGKLQAPADFQCLKEWDIEDQIAALCFDTAASNISLNLINIIAMILAH